MNPEESERRIVSEIQQSLLPPTPQVPRCDFGAGIRPLQGAGGDFFDFIPLPDGTLGIVIGDVAGSGIGPALLMATTLAYLRAVARTHSDIGEIVRLVNQMVIEDLGTQPRFTTLQFLRLDPHDLTLTCVNAGHYAGWILHPSGKCSPLTDSSASGLPVGIDPEADFQVSQPVALETGDLLFLTTDGLLDLQRDSPDPILELISANRHRPAQELVDLLFSVADLRTVRPPGSAPRPARDAGDGIEGLSRLLARSPDLQWPRDDRGAVIVKVDDLASRPVEPADRSRRSGGPDQPADDVPLLDVTSEKCEVVSLGAPVGRTVG